ncbi:ORF2 [Anelloviridae sp.]|nr:ORF2 [Anelloviridae sp.]
MSLIFSEKKLVYCTAQTLWITSCVEQHNKFCNCGDPAKHLARCLASDGGDPTVAGDPEGGTVAAGVEGGDGGDSAALDALLAAFEEDEG